MAVKRYDGSQWVTVAGKGDQGTSSSIATWVKTVSGGETSVSGNDDNSQPLSYTVGQELVFINGTLLKRGSDYTATTGNSITGLTALAANDVVTVWTVNAFSVTDAISNTIVNAKGDLITASGADVPAILTAGTTGQVLTVDSTTSTGLKWATPAAGGKILQVVSGSTSTETTSSSSTFADTGLSATITPSSTTSTILVFVSQNGIGKFSGNTQAQFRLVRGSTTILNFEAFAGHTANTNTNFIGGVSAAYIDSPATTSATTYKTQFNSQANVGTVKIQDNNSPGSASTIILMEVGA